MNARRGALPCRVQSIDAGPADQIGHQPADRVVGCRRDGDRLDCGIEALLRDQVHQAGKPRPIDRSQVQEDAALGDDCPSHLVPRRQFVNESLALFVYQDRAFAPQRLGKKQPRSLEDRRVELHELHVGHGRARSDTDCHGIADLADRVRGTSPQCRRAAHCQDGSPGCNRAVGRDHTEAAPAIDPQAQDGRRFSHCDPVGSGHSPPQKARDCPAGLGALDARDSSAGMAGLQIHLRVERNSQRDELTDALRALLHQNLDRARTAEVAAGALRVDPVQVGGVIVADRTRNPALGMPARRVGAVAFGQHQHTCASLGRRQSGRQAGRTGTYDEDVQ